MRLTEEETTMGYRTAAGQPEHLPGLVAELVRLPVDVIVTGGENAARVVVAFWPGSGTIRPPTSR